MQFQLRLRKSWERTGAVTRMEMMEKETAGTQHPLRLCCSRQFAAASAGSRQGRCFRVEEQR